MAPGAERRALRKGASMGARAELKPAVRAAGLGPGGGVVKGAELGGRGGTVGARGPGGVLNLPARLGLLCRSRGRTRRRRRGQEQAEGGHLQGF